jgi:hypothetical protein
VRRGWLAIFLLLVIYVALDLSLPAMPGAFVFDPAHCIESVQTREGREPGVQPTASLLPGSQIFAQTPADVGDVSSPTTEIRGPSFHVVNRLPRAMLAPAPASEDPQ